MENIISNFTSILTKQFDNEEVFFQLEDVINNLERTDHPDDIGHELEDLIDMLIDKDMWSVEEAQDISVSETLESAGMDGWTSGKTPNNPKVYALTHDDELISDRVYAVVVAEGEEIHAICLQLD